MLLSLSRSLFLAYQSIAVPANLLVHLLCLSLLPLPAVVVAAVIGSQSLSSFVLSSLNVSARSLTAVIALCLCLWLCF